VFQRLFVFCALALTLSAADFSGIWSGQRTDQNGDVQDLSFRFIQKGDTLTGKNYGDNESTPIAEAKIVGNEITFSVTGDLNGQITKFVYTGTIDGDEIHATRQRVGGNAASAPGKNKMESFVLKRVA
jgi:hypothetical protein